MTLTIMTMTIYIMTNDLRGRKCKGVPDPWGEKEAEESVECGCFSFAPFDTSKGNLDDFSLLSVLFAWVLLFYSFTNMVPTRSR